MIGIIIGKLKIAINVELLLALAEMAEMNVNVIEKPILPKNKAVKNWFKRSRPRNSKYLLVACR